VTFANPLPWWALIAALAAGGFVAWLAYRHAPLSRAQRGGLGAVRFLTLLLLLVFLMRPVERHGPDGPSEAVVPILVDTSRSMSIEDAQGARRIDRARATVVEKLLPAFSGRFHTEILAFGEDVRQAAAHDLTAWGRRSDLAGALEAVRERYRGRVVAGIVLLSDGGETGGALDRAAADAAAPVFALGIGSPGVERDREVLSVTAAEAVLDQSRVELAVSAVSHGYGQAPVELRLLENGRPIDVRRVNPAADGSPVRQVFQVTPGAAASTVYTIEIPSSADELVPENNARSVLIQPPARKRRVLLVQGAPGFEHSFLRRAWSGDTGLEIDSIVRKGKNDQGADTFYIQAASGRGPSLASGFPATREALFAYDALVLANVEGSVLTRAQLEAAREFVERRGGGLLVLGAQAFVRRGLMDTPLEELLPLDLAARGGDVLPAASRSPGGANRIALTPAGASHPIMQLAADAEASRERWAAVPALAATTTLGGPRPGATVLAVSSGPGGAPQALVAVQRYGEGRTMVFTGEAAWRWRMLLPAADRTYETFWRQAVRWLALRAADPVAIAPPAGAAPGDVVPLRIAARGPGYEPLSDATVDVRVTRPDGRVDSVPAAMDAAGGGVFLARYRAEDSGVYRVTADVHRPGQPTTAATSAMLVGGADPEMTDPRLNLRVLQRLAASTGGRVVGEGDMSALAGELRARIPAATLLVRRDLWHHGWSFAAIVAALTTEWLLRRRWGLR
jgi:uncharacterized membrane protein